LEKNKLKIRREHYCQGGNMPLAINIYKLIKIILFVVAVTIITGCGLSAPAPKPEVGPAGETTDAPPNPPFWARFESPPAELYDIEALAGSIFAGINTGNWEQAQTGYNSLVAKWEQTKPLIGDKKGVKEAEQALADLAPSLVAKQITVSYEILNKYMSAISDIGESYKLSPVADLVTIGNMVRNVSFYVEDNNWPKAAAKVKELEDSWNQLKPGLEKVGILSEITKAHSKIKQLKDAVNAENKGAVENHLKGLNEHLARIREYYRGK